MEAPLGADHVYHQAVAAQHEQVGAQEEEEEEEPLIGQLRQAVQGH